MNSVGRKTDGQAQFGFCRLQIWGKMPIVMGLEYFIFNIFQQKTTKFMETSVFSIFLNPATRPTSSKSTSNLVSKRHTSMAFRVSRIKNAGWPENYPEMKRNMNHFPNLHFWVKILVFGNVHLHELPCFHHLSLSSNLRPPCFNNRQFCCIISFPFNFHHLPNVGSFRARKTPSLQTNTSQTPPKMMAFFGGHSGIPKKWNFISWSVFQSPSIFRGLD